MARGAASNLGAFACLRVHMKTIVGFAQLTTFFCKACPLGNHPLAKGYAHVIQSFEQFTVA